jgi:hypothetical protein
MSASEHDLDLAEALDAGVRLRVVAQFKNLSPRELRVRALQLLALAAQLDHIADNGSEDNGVRSAARRLRDGARLLDDRATRATVDPNEATCKLSNPLPHARGLSPRRRPPASP